MKISHRQVRLILRILHCLGAFFGLFVFIYEVYIQHNIIQSIGYICYFLVTAAVLYLLFARKQPSRRIAYIIFYAMSFVTVLFFLSYIYASVTTVSNMTNELIGYIEHDKAMKQPTVEMVRASKCCSIDDERHINANFLSFQKKFPDTCGQIEFANAISCQQAFRGKRNFTILISCIMIVLRVLALILLWKYIKDEYSGNNDDSISVEALNG